MTETSRARYGHIEPEARVLLPRPKALFRLLDSLLTGAGLPRDARGRMRHWLARFEEHVGPELGLVGVAGYAEREWRWDRIYATPTLGGLAPEGFAPEAEVPTRLAAASDGLLRAGEVPLSAPHGTPRRPLAAMALLVQEPRARYLLLLFLEPEGDAALREFVLLTLRSVLAARLLQQRWGSALSEAAEIQRGLLPAAAPTVRGYEVAARAVTAEEVGGDLVDWKALPSGDLAFVLADASGHGLPAALVARDVRTGLRLALESGLGLGRALEALNRVLHEAGGGSFVSAFVGLAGADGLLRYANAGHLPPLVLGPDGVTPLVHADGVLGPLPHATWRLRWTRLLPGEALLVFSDGLQERRDSRGAFFGEEGVAAAARGAQGRPAREILDAVFEAARGHAQGPWEDDASAIVVRRRAP